MMNTMRQKVCAEKVPNAKGSLVDVYQPFNLNIILRYIIILVDYLSQIFNINPKSCVKQMLTASLCFATLPVCNHLGKLAFRVIQVFCQQRYKVKIKYRHNTQTLDFLMESIKLCLCWYSRVEQVQYFFRSSSCFSNNMSPHAISSRTTLAIQ